MECPEFRLLQQKNMLPLAELLGSPGVVLEMTTFISPRYYFQKYMPSMAQVY